MATQSELADLGDYLSTQRYPSDGTMDQSEFQAYRKRLHDIARRLSQSQDDGIQRIGIRLLADGHSHNAQREIQQYLNTASSLR